MEQAWQVYKVPLILAGASLLLIIISLTILIKSFQTTSPIQFSSDPSTPFDKTQDKGSGQGSSLITIDIEGAVVKPGVYQLPAGSRVEEAMAMAGGLSPEADEALIAKTINRAAKLTDGAKLFFPPKGSEQGSSEGSGLDSSKGLTPILLVSVNSASAAELEALPGIGPVTARKIIDSRPYQTLEELVSKKALSRSLFEKLKEQLTL